LQKSCFCWKLFANKGNTDGKKYQQLFYKHLSLNHFQTNCLVLKKIL